MDEYGFVTRSLEMHLTLISTRLYNKKCKKDTETAAEVQQTVNTKETKAAPSGQLYTVYLIPASTDGKAEAAWRCLH
jgi:hypothetical protein